MNTSPPIPAPFGSADGISFFHGPGLEDYLTIRAGSYPSGNGALWLVTSTGEPECKLTVNLEPYGAPKLEDAEFYVKVSEVSPVLCAALVNTGFFLATPARYDSPNPKARPYVAQGYVERYADVWSFAPCLFDRTAHRFDGLCVECPKCRARHQEWFDTLVEERKAADSVHRLKPRVVSRAR